MAVWTSLGQFSTRLESGSASEAMRWIYHHLRRLLNLTVVLEAVVAGLGRVGSSPDDLAVVVTVVPLR